MNWVGFGVMALLAALFVERPRPYDGIILGLVWYVGNLFAPI